MRGLSTSFEAVAELLGRYTRAWALAWRHRKELEPPPRLPHEAQFLPAALALQDTPVSPLPRVTMWALIAFCAILVAWSVFGRIDVVATARGKVVPGDRVKVIQPFETATVKGIHVSDGQEVRIGDLLIELDATTTAADKARIESDLASAKLEAARAAGFLQALAGGTVRLQALPEVARDRFRKEADLLAGEWLEYRTQRERAEADVAGRGAELRSTEELVAKLEKMAALASTRAADYKTMRESEIVSRHGVLDQEQNRVNLDGELASQRQKQVSISAALTEARKRLASVTAEASLTAQSRLREAEGKVSTLTHELAKATRRDQQMRLVAPVAGFVQQLAVHTVGGVVTPAQPLLVIVPREDALEVEAYLENKDIGFVDAGQAAEIKIETFPYTKYGVLHAKVMTVSSDAINDEKLGLVYLSLIRMEKATMRVGSRTVRVSPGMAVTAEIKTGKRRVVEFFLTPLIQYSRESLRER